jgi:D-tyrosyl-tRNA(Tyr) deacylase
MKALIQRVSKAKVTVDDVISGEINKGILIFLGITHNDSTVDIHNLVDKIVNLRIFENGDKSMDKSVLEINGDLLVVSQFTLFGNTKKGRRPDFTDAAKPDFAKKLYEEFIKECEKTGLKVQTGIFSAMMDVELVNDGPVTFMIDSHAKA